MAANAGSSSQSNLPPLPHRRGGSSQHPLLKTLLPGVLALGVGAAAIALLEQRTGSVSTGYRRARSRAGDAADYLGEAVPDWWDSATETTSHTTRRAKKDLIAAGAKAAGLVGVLKTLGGGHLSTGSARALKALAAKKAAEYAAQIASAGGRFAKNHPGITAAGTYGAARTRSLGHDAADTWDEWRHRLFGTPRRRKQEDHTLETALTSLAVLGLGAAALYLFSQSTRGQRAMTVAQRQAAHTAKLAREEAERLREGLTSGISSTVERARAVVGSHQKGERQARSDEEIVSEVRRAIQEKLSKASDKAIEVQVASSEGIVTVSGKLDEAARKLAQTAAKAVSGVREVTLTNG